MIDAAIRWALGNPLWFVAVLCIVAGVSGLSMAPAVKEQINNNHPRC